MPPMRPPMFGPPRANYFRGATPPMGGRGLFGASMPRGGNPLGAAGAPKQGGFLSSLFGRGGGSGLARGAGSAAKAASGGSTLTNFMSSTQKVLAAGERVVPMVRQVQQYGPLIKNLPSMWKIYRGLNSSTTEDTNDEVSNHQYESDSIDSSSHTSESSTVKRSRNRKEESSEVAIASELPKSSTSEPKASTVKPSVPKLFI